MTTYPMLLNSTTGKPIIVLVDAVCPNCEAIAAGSIRHGSIHVPCEACGSACANMDIPFGDAIPIVFQYHEGKATQGVISRRIFRKRFPGAKTPRRVALARDWEKIVADHEARSA